MKPFKSIPRLLCACLLVVVLPAAAGAHRVVRVGWYEFGNISTYNVAEDPTGGTGNGDYPNVHGGYNYEYLRMISQINDWELQFVQGTMNESLARLQQGQVDIVGGVARTPVREQNFIFPHNSVLRSSIGLIARGDDNRYTMNGTTGFSHMRIGAVRDSNPAFQIQEWCRQRNVDVEMVYFDSFEQMHEALAEGAVDAVTDSLLFVRPDRKILASIETSGVYFAVNKNEPDLARELDDAVTYIQYLKPGYQEALTSKYFNSQTYNVFSPSREERDYLEQRIASGRPVLVSFNPNWFPIEYKDPQTGEPRGIMADIFERISQMTGLTFQFVSEDTYADTTKRYLHEAEIAATISTDFSWADQHNAYLTQSFFEVPVFVVAMPDSGNNMTVALPRGYHLAQAVQNRLYREQENVTYQYYGSIEECLQAVRDGQAGRTYINSYELNYYMNQDKFSLLKIQAVPGFTEAASIGVSKDADPRLLSIICQALRSIQPDDMDNIILNATKPKTSRSLQDVVYSHPMGSAAAAAVFALLAGGLGFFYYSNKRSEKLRQELEIANRAKTDFLSRMSHDIRTPMNAIMGLTEIASHTTQEAATRESLDKIDQSSQFLLRLINDILDISRIESDSFVLHPEPYDREEFAVFIDSTIMPLAEAKGVSFKYQLMADLPCLFVDKLRFNQIFTNRLGNAVKFTPPGGHVRMALQNEGLLQGQQCIAVTVQDDGIGISKVFLPHIFEFFEQENVKHTKVDEGTGLGLAIVKRIVEAMGGTISVSSEKGKGTTFELHLKVDILIEEKRRSEEKEISPAVYMAGTASPEREALLKGKHVLLVEDNEINQEVARAQLEAAGVSCDTAGDGQEALERFQQSPEGFYDAVLMDIRMPVMDGKEATRRLRKLSRKDAAAVSIIALTADAFEDARRDIMECGMNDYLAKPVNAAMLYDVLLKNLT